MATDKTNPDTDKIILGPEVWQRVFNWRVFNHIVAVFKQIFKRRIGCGDLGKVQDEVARIRGPVAEPLPLFPFCEFINSTERGKERCLEKHKQSYSQMAACGKPVITTCHAGLIEVGVPIIFHNKYCGCVGTVRGGLLFHEPNETHWQEIVNRVKNIGVDLEALKKAYFQITPLSEELLKIMLQLMQASVEEVIKAVVETDADKKRIKALEMALHQKYNFDKIIGQSEAMQNVFKMVRQVIDNDSPILIEGETGTGKELIASTIHYNSPRKNKPFTPVNCGGFAETLLESELFGHVKGSFTGASGDKKGIFEVTDQGTIFLDEVAEMSPALQVKLLRVLQEGTFLPVGTTQPRKVDIRIISATNKNLKELVHQGKFREDLYYRINVIKVIIPPLRDRKEDIPLLINYFIKTKPEALRRKIVGVKQDTLKIMLNHHWPGNIRELQNVLERAVSLTTSKYIRPEDLPEEIIKDTGKNLLPVDGAKLYEQAKKHILDYFHKEYISQILNQTHGNVTKAARHAGLGRTTFYMLLKKYHLSPDEFKIK